uniref:Uncharacterized protein n=1 Tax=Theropithecus gelada TaxID=9565 RepID=A0A8D2K1D9_THEGE
MQPHQSKVPAFRQLRQELLLPFMIGLSRPGCSLLASSPGPALPPSCIYRPNSCLTATSLDSVPAQFLAAYVGPKLPEAKLSRPSSGLTVASAGGSTPTLRRSLHTPKLPPDSSSRPSLGPLAQVVLKSASLGPATTSQPPLQAQVFLNSASPAQLSPLGCLSRCTTSSRQPLQSQVSSCLSVAFPGPTSGQPLWAQPAASCRPVYRPSLCLTTDPPTPRPQPLCSLPSRRLLPSGSFDRPHSCLLMVSKGPAHPSQPPFRTQFVPFWWPLKAQKLLKLAHPDPAAASQCPLQTQLFLPAVSTGPTPASRQPLWTQLLPSSWWHLQAHNFLKPNSPGPAQASCWPLQEAQLLPSTESPRPQTSSKWLL